VPEPKDPQQLNRYSYGLNNPVKYRDPSGHCALVGENDDVCIAYNGETPLRIIKGGSEFVNFTEMDLASAALFGARTGLPSYSAFYNLAIIPAKGGPPPAWLKPMGATGPGPLAEGMANYARLGAAWLDDLMTTMRTPRMAVTAPEASMGPLTPEQVHGIGVEQGRAQAAQQGLEPTEWQNPFANRGAYGQGFDDVMRAPNGDLVIVEYKGGSSKLAPGQMGEPWVVNNIQKLINAGDPMGFQLQTAFEQGRLSGVVYSTPIVNGVSQPTIAQYWFWYGP
jgi:hypothetical protein